MFDIFLKEDVCKLMKNKSIVFLGDSNIRALYKDFLCLLQNSKFINDAKLKKKMENSVYGDQLVYHGRQTNGRCYREEREASITGGTRASFFFLTKVYDGYVEDVIDRITRRSNPDVIIINSCVWDITRWGCNGVYDYKDNLRYLMKKFRRLLPNCLIIWVTTPPLAVEMKGGFLVKELKFLKYSLRFHVVEANHFARKVVVENGFDVLDSHFHLHMQIHRRSPDGIHWDIKAIRYVTNLILRHISLSWNVPLPHRYESSIVDENLIASEDNKNSRIIKLVTKKNVDKKQVDSKELDVLEQDKKLRSMVTVVNRKEDAPKNRRGSIQLYRVPKKEESIHKHIAKADIKARLNRIRQWKQPLLGDSPQSYTPCSSHNSRQKKRSRKKAKRPSYKSTMSGKLFQSHQQNLNDPTPSTPVHNSLKGPLKKSLHHKAPLLTDPNQIPLPSYSSGYSQPWIGPVQNNESQPPTFNESNNFDFSLITSPSQIPLPPGSPSHHHTGDRHMRNVEYPEEQSDQTVYFDFPVITSPSQIPCYEELNNVPSQRRVVDYQSSRGSLSSLPNNRNKTFSYSQSFLDQQFRQQKRTFNAFNDSSKPYEFPYVAPGQILNPNFDFLNDEIPQVYRF